VQQRLDDLDGDAVVCCEFGRRGVPGRESAVGRRFGREFIRISLAGRWIALWRTVVGGINVELESCDHRRSFGRSVAGSVIARVIALSLRLVGRLVGVVGRHVGPIGAALVRPICSAGRLIGSVADTCRDDSAGRDRREFIRPGGAVQDERQLHPR
jgi:hypothetical protein